MGDSGRRYDRDYDCDYVHCHRKRSRSRSRSPTRSSRSRYNSDLRRRRSPSPSPPPRQREPSEAHRKAVNATKAVPLEQFRKDYHAGKYSRLSFCDKFAMFGTTIMPIFVPLSPGETEDQCEIRFRAWLHRLGRSLERLRADSDPYRERQIRVEFANANVMGYERYDQFDWSQEHKSDATIKPRTGSPSAHQRGSDTRTSKQSEQDKTQTNSESRPTDSSRERAATPRETPQRRCPSKHPSVSNGLASAALAGAHLSCGCTPCLSEVMRHTAQQVQAVESAQTQAAARNVADLTDEYLVSATQPRM